MSRFMRKIVRVYFLLIQLTLHIIPPVNKVFRGYIVFFAFSVTMIVCVCQLVVFYPILYTLDMQYTSISDEFEIRPDSTTNCGVSCP